MKVKLAKLLKWIVCCSFCFLAGLWRQRQPIWPDPAPLALLLGGDVAELNTRENLLMCCSLSGCYLHSFIYCLVSLVCFKHGNPLKKNTLQYTNGSFIGKMHPRKTSIDSSYSQVVTTSGIRPKLEEPWMSIPRNAHYNSINHGCHLAFPLSACSLRKASPVVHTGCSSNLFPSAGV